MIPGPRRRQLGWDPCPHCKLTPALHPQFWASIVEPMVTAKGRPARSPPCLEAFCQKGCLHESGRGKKVVVRTRQPWGQSLFLPVSSYLVAFLSEPLLASKMWNNKFGCDDQKRSSGPSAAWAPSAAEPGTSVSRGCPIWRHQRHNHTHS